MSFFEWMKGKSDVIASVEKAMESLQWIKSFNAKFKGGKETGCEHVYLPYLPPQTRNVLETVFSDSSIQIGSHVYETRGEVGGIGEQYLIRYPVREWEDSDEEDEEEEESEQGFTNYMSGYHGGMR